MMQLISKIWKKLPPWLRLRLTRATQHKFTASVVGVISNERGEVLLLDHVLRPASGWGLPGGFLKPHEQPEDGLRREIREETGLELTEVKHFRTRTIRRHVEVLFTARSNGDGSIGTREISDIRWFPIDDIPTEMNVGQQNLIREIFRRTV